MFTRSARFYDAIYAFKDYAAEADRLHELIQAARPGARSLLDVACGTGRHLEHLRGRYDASGVDLDPELLAIAAERLPGTELRQGDMAEFDLGRTFDAVTCLFSSIGYMRTPERLDAAVANLARHAAAGGVVLVEPWFGPDSYEYGGVYATFVDEPDLKIARINHAGPPGPTSVLEFHYLVGTGSSVDHFTERHELGLFDAARYEDAFRHAGLAVRHEPEGLMGRGLYVGVKPR